MRNIDAQTRGGELEGRWQFAEQWRLDGGLAVVYGENQSDNKPLAQMPPLDGKLALGWQPDEALSFTLLGRAVAAQDRVNLWSGTVAGQDQGETPGFFTMNLSGAWQFAKGWQLSAGWTTCSTPSTTSTSPSRCTPVRLGWAMSRAAASPSRGVPTGSRSTTVLPRQGCSNQLSQITFSVTDTAV